MLELGGHEKRRKRGWRGEVECIIGCRVTYLVGVFERPTRKYYTWSPAVIRSIESYNKLVNESEVRSSIKMLVIHEQNNLLSTLVFISRRPLCLGAENEESRTTRKRGSSHGTFQRRTTLDSEKLGMYIDQDLENLFEYQVSGLRRERILCVCEDDDVRLGDICKNVSKRMFTTVNDICRANNPE